MPETTLTECAQPLFYYFLRKTGDPTAAEDLSADVLLAALTALRKGQVISHPHAWVWQVARRRYAAWADSQRRSRLREAEEAEADHIPAPEDALSALIHEEELTEELYSSALVDRLVEGFTFLMPYYDYFSTLWADPDPRTPQ